MTENWLEKESARLKQEQEKFLESSQFLKLKKGVNEITFYPKPEPTFKDDKFNKPKAYFQVNNNQVYDVNTKSPIYRSIIEILEKNKDKDTVVIKIQRFGEGKDSKYEIIE
jgi:hypothetical protein